jgi:hypothetical protein
MKSLCWEQGRLVGEFGCVAEEERIALSLGRRDEVHKAGVAIITAARGRVDMALQVICRAVKSAVQY